MPKGGGGASGPQQSTGKPPDRQALAEALAAMQQRQQADMFGSPSEGGQGGGGYRANQMQIARIRDRMQQLGPAGGSAATRPTTFGGLPIFYGNTPYPGA